MDKNVKLKLVINKCMEKENYTAFKHLSLYDKFVLGNLLISHNGNSNTALRLAILSREEGVGNYTFLQLFRLFCLNEARCDATMIDKELADIASQIIFLFERCFALLD